MLSQLRSLKEVVTGSFTLASFRAANRLIALLALTSTVILIGTPPAIAQETAPGNACTAGELNLIRQSGGPETTGVVNLMRCNGTVWQQYMTFLTSGNVGFGNTSPSERLDVVGQIRIDDNPSLGSQGCFRYNGTSGRIEFSHDCSNYSIFGEPIWLTGAAQDIYYNTGTPEVGIGTASPAYTLDVNGVIRATNHIVINPTAGATTPTFFDLDDLTSVTITSPSNGQVLTYNAGSWVNSAAGGLWTQGTGNNIYYNTGTPRVAIGKTTPNVTLDVVGDINFTGVLVDVSDISQKTAIHAIERPLEKLLTLNGFSFQMKNDVSGNVEYGVSAQDVQKAFPELVHKLDSSGTLGVSYMGLMAPMIEAIKEQQRQIESLKAEIEALKEEHQKTTPEDL